MTKALSAVFAPLLLSASFWGCTSPSRAAADQTPTLTPASDVARQWDCAGANQTKKGATRKDCLPNKADEAERDTLQESRAGQGW